MKYYATQLSDKLTDTDELYKEWTGNHPDYKRILTNTYYTIVRKREDGTIVGSAQLIIIDDPIWNRRWGLIENVYVAKNDRNQGIGTMLMEDLEVQAKGLGCDFLKLTSSKDKIQAHKLYDSLGYTRGYSYKKRIL